jgi:hypothetical protein
LAEVQLTGTVEHVKPVAPQRGDNRRADQRVGTGNEN